MKFVLRDNQRLELDTTGIARLPGVLSEERAAEMAEAIWGSLAQRGIDRADRETWPEGFVGGHQKLKTSRVFSDFETARTSELVDSLLAPGEWEPNRPWAPCWLHFRNTSRGLCLAGTGIWTCARAGTRTARKSSACLV